MRAPILFPSPASGLQVPSLIRAGSPRTWHCSAPGSRVLLQWQAAFEALSLSPISTQERRKAGWGESSVGDRHPGCCVPVVSSTPCSHPGCAGLVKGKGPKNACLGPGWLNWKA